MGKDVGEEDTSVVVQGPGDLLEKIAKALESLEGEPFAVSYPAMHDTPELAERRRDAHRERLRVAYEMAQASSLDGFSFSSQIPGTGSPGQSRCRSDRNKS